MAGDDEEHRPPFWNHDDHSYDINSKIMVIAIISLSVVVVLVILLHIYARCVLRRQAQRRAILRRLGQHPASPRLHVNGSEPQPPKTGLDASVIASLPIFIFKQVDPNDENSSLECAVCLSMLERDEMARVLPNCNHTFHAECIDKWLGSHSTCPICRSEAEPKVEPQAAVEAAAAATASTGGLPPTAPPLEISSMEGTSSSAKVVSGSSSRLSSFRRMLSREKSSRRMQSSSQDQDHHGIEDLERQ